MGQRTSLPNFGVRAVDPSSLPSDYEVGDVVDILANLKGVPLVYLLSTLNYAIDSISTQPVHVTTVRSTALATNLVIRATPGYLVQIRGQNDSGAAQYIQVHDAASLPGNGAVPKEVIKVSAGTSFSISPKSNLQFSVGIVVCNSSTAATLTVGSADCWFSADIEA